MSSLKKTVIMAPNLNRLEGYLFVRQLDPDDFTLVTKEEELMWLPRGIEVTMVINHCDWEEERVLKKRALEREMIVSEVYG